MAGQFDGDDIWGFSAHDTSGQMDLTDSLRLSAGGYFLTSSTGEQIPPAELVGAHMGGAIDENGLDMSHLQAVGQHPHLMGDGSLQTSSYVMDSHHLTPDPESSDLRFSTGVEMNLTSSNPPYIKPEYTSPGQAPATVAFETYGTLPPANKKKRRREHDVIEATIQYGNGNGPVITTPQSVASSSSHHSGSEASYGSHGHDSNGQDDIVYVDNIPEQQQTPVLPRDHIQPYLDDFYDIRLNVIALRPQQYRILKQEKSRIGEQKETIQRLSARLQAIEEAFLALKTEAILHPSDINRMFCIQPDLHSCRVQLELYMNEINHTLSPNEAWKSTELVLEEHPFPISLKQKENVPKVVVRLLTGACTNITHVSAVEARVVSTSTGSPKPPEMINYQEKMRLTAYHREAEQAQQNEAGGQGYTAVFENLNFLTGTRMKDFSLVFTCKVSLGGGKSEFNETIPTPPFVVFTNGNQWNDIEGILLRWEAFGGSSTTVWCRLANSLQRRYIMATMQLPEEPQRPLSRSDFTFLFQTKIDPKLSTFLLALSCLFSISNYFDDDLNPTYLATIMIWCILRPDTDHPPFVLFQLIQWHFKYLLPLF